MATFLPLVGVSIGAGNFAILGKLRGTLVAQAVVFIVMVYILGLIKTLRPKYVPLLPPFVKCHKKCRPQIVVIVAPGHSDDFLWRT